MEGQTCLSWIVDILLAFASGIVLIEVACVVGDVTEPGGSVR